MLSPNLSWLSTVHQRPTSNDASECGGSSASATTSSSSSSAGGVHPRLRGSASASASASGALEGDVSLRLTSEQVNTLIYAYMEEAGFKHSAYTFRMEVLKGTPGPVPPFGALISFLLKGLQYYAIECHLRPDGTEITDCDELFSVLSPHKCNNNRKHSPPHETSSTSTQSASQPTQSSQVQATPVKSRDTHATASTENSKSTTTTMEEAVGNDSHTKEAHDTPQATLPQPATTAPTAMDTDAIDIPQSSITLLSGHTHEVFVCSWNPVSDLLASGAGDSTARIWNLGSADVNKPLILPHPSVPALQDVTAIDWNMSGTLLATGSYDGVGRLWKKDGTNALTLQQHTGPIFTIKWNQTGNFLLTGSTDHTVVVWDTSTGEQITTFRLHTGAILDVDWRDPNTFATCSTDCTIYVCQLYQVRPLAELKGHKNEVNGIKWDPSGTLLASCSDDRTAKIWDPAKSSECIHSFAEHTKEVYTLKWCPVPHSQLLATASFDCSVKLWDVSTGTCLHTLARHAEPVYAIGFSPNGEFLASGSFDRCIHIWSTKTGNLVATHNANGGIFEVCWNSLGNKLAASFSTGELCVIQFPTKQ
ncbi:Apolipoprotein A-IV [Pelomyxa schiedti]|nr:Apolipoprotein A-IV [Pelomyxa schiedti]